MVRHLDHKKRQDEILDLIIEAYINEGKPVGSEYLREKHNLPFSSATVRNIMVELEELGYLGHLHTSSGRVPTQEGFRYYIDFLMRQEDSLREDYSAHIEWEYIKKVDDLLQEASRLIAHLTHYAGFSLLHHKRDRVFMWGTHFILHEPEFEDITTLRNIFTTLEERHVSLCQMLGEHHTGGVKVFIGDEIGLEEMSACSLVFSELSVTPETKAFLGVLGPVRMNYSMAISKLNALKEYLESDHLGMIE